MSAERGRERGSRGMILLRMNPVIMQDTCPCTTYRVEIVYVCVCVCVCDGVCVCDAWLVSVVCPAPYGVIPPSAIFRYAVSSKFLGGGGKLFQVLPCF